MYQEKGNLENITLIFSRIRSSYLYRNQEKKWKGGTRENNNIYSLVVDLLQYIDTFYFNAKILYNKSSYSNHYIQSIKVSNNIIILNILSIVIYIENYFVKLFQNDQNIHESLFPIVRNVNTSLSSSFLNRSISPDSLMLSLASTPEKSP
jgi:hypothetical protein